MDGFLSSGQVGNDGQDVRMKETENDDLLKSRIGHWGINFFRL